MNSSFHIPANYTDAGKLWGNFEIRNAIEAVILVIPIIYLCIKHLPFNLTTNLSILMILTIPLGGFALIGVNDDCLTKFVYSWWKWRRNKGIITYKGLMPLKKGRFDK